MKKSYFLGVIFGFLLIWGATILSGVRLAVYVNVPSFLMVIGLSGITLLFSWDMDSIRRSFSAVFSTNPSRKDLRKGIDFFSASTKYLFLAAAIATGTGFIAILTNLTDMRRLGAVVALALLSTYYSLILTLFVTLPFRYSLRKKLIEQEES